MQEIDAVDVGGDGVRLRLGALERSPPDEGTAAGQHDVDPFSVLRRHHPVTDRHIGPEVPEAQGRALRADQRGAPPTIEPGDPGRGHLGAARRVGGGERAVPAQPDEFRIHVFIMP